MTEKYMDQQRRKSRGSGKSQRRANADWEISTGNSENEELMEWLQTVKFRKVLIGGLDERCVWKKIEELNSLYEAAVKAERIRYDAMLKEYRKACNDVIRKYKRELYEREKAGHCGRKEEPGDSSCKGAGR